ncbi:MAG: TIGR04086 family membrane protein [Clostridia bacterium]|nr:TIGR04086 family membrane protein [Clostridia bacterium]
MRKNIFQIVKAAAAAIILSLLLVLIFTLIIQLFSLPTGAVKPVNQVIKILSIIGGGLIFIRGDKGWLKGIIYGVAAVLITYLLYGLIAHSLSISWKFAIEILIGAAAGAITGIIAVNIKKGA